MSTMIINTQSLANVRASLAKSFIWREDSDTTPLCVFDAFIPNASRFQAKREKMSQAALNFVTLALVFNLEEYSGGKYAKINAEPVDYKHFIKLLKFTEGKPLSKAQLVKTLQCIKYNTSVKGWLTDGEYNQWSRRIEYIKFHKTLDRLIGALLADLVDQLDSYKAAVWG